jgi:type VI secretion system VasI/ImpG family protein
MDLLDYYRDNLSYLRGLSAEFAAEFPKIARRLLLSEFDCQDPYIERLLEGTAFLAARVEKKLDEGYYPFLESVLGSIAPDALYPVPSGAVLEVSPNSADERGGGLLPAGTVFETVIPGINTPCRFSSAEDAPLAPFTLNQAEYIYGDVSGLGINDPQAESALRLQFSGEALGPWGEVRLYLALPEAEVSLLLRLLAHDVAAMYGKRGGRYEALEGVWVDIPMMTGEKLFGTEIRSNTRGLRILQNYLLYPDFFKFFSILGLSSPGGSRGPITDMAVVFKRREQALIAGVKTSSVRLNCVPCLNLFSKRSDRITIDRDGAGIPAYEFHLAPDRTAMRDYEIAAVKGIDFYNQRNERIYRALGFYGTGVPDKKKQIFFSLKRRRKPVTRRSAARSTYDGTEVFVSFSPAPEEDVYQFAADLLVTNRDLPLLLQGGAQFSSSAAPAQRAVFLTAPTRPGYPLAERGGPEDFTRLSHIVMNLSALLWQEGARPLELWRNMLRSYPIRPPEETERMISGITALDSGSSTFRFIRDGVVFYEWGWTVRLELDENAYEGMGFYMFARVMGEILRAFTPINTFLEIQVATLQSGVIAVWKSSENQ